jgi:HK97 family phage major capsid protein
MVTGIQQAYDSRAAIVTQMQEITQAASKEGRAMTQEEVSKWDKMEADEAALTRTINATEKTERFAAEQAAKHFEQRDAAGQVWTSTSTKQNDKGKEDEYRDTYSQYLKRGLGSLTTEQRGLLQTRGTNTQVVGTDGLGGFLVPDTWQPEIERIMLDYSGIMQAARILRTAGGNTLYWPSEDDTSTLAVKTAEAAAVTVADLTFTEKRLDAYKYTSMIKVSEELLQDAAYDIQGEIAAAFGPRFGRIMNQECTLGDGSGDPNGIVTATSAGKTTASATAITFLEVLDLKHSIDPAYRMAPTFGFMFNDSVLLYLKKLVDSESRPLWTPSYREGQPDTIDGTRYYINQGMDSSINASSKIMLCGDFNKYIIRISKDMSVTRLNELYAENGLVGFRGVMRFDGELINAGAVKHMITAA